MIESVPPLSGMNILVVGDAMLDHYWWCQVARISPEAPVPVVTVKRKTSMLGGAANVAANLAGLGCNATLLGSRGRDEAGSILSAKLRELGIDDQLMKDVNRPTTTKTRVLAQGQQLIRLDEEEIGTIPEQAVRQLFARYEELLTGQRAVVLSDYGKGVLAGGICRQMISLARERQIPVLVDPKGRDWDRYAGASCITPNEAELEGVAERAILSDADLLSEAQRIRTAYDLAHLLVTRGAKGMILVDDRVRAKAIAARPQEVFDVSGAGDTVVAVLAAGVAAGLDWLRAAELANAAAGVVVGKVGTHAIGLAELEVALRMDGVGSFHKMDNLAAAKIKVDSWRTLGQRIVFTNGCFDLLHAGHIKLLHAAAKEGDRLVVGLNSDRSVRRLKGNDRPILNQQDRGSILAALACVDLVVIFDEETPLNLIEALQPDVLVKGADYSREKVVGYQLVESWGGRVVLVPLAAGSSTTSIVQAIQKNSVS